MWFSTKHWTAVPYSSGHKTNNSDNSWRIRSARIDFFESSVFEVHQKRQLKPKAHISTKKRQYAPPRTSKAFELEHQIKSWDILSKHSHVDEPYYVFCVSSAKKSRCLYYNSIIRNIRGYHWLRSRDSSDWDANADTRRRKRNVSGLAQPKKNLKAPPLHKKAPCHLGTEVIWMYLQ